MRLGHGPNETKKYFYEKTQISVLVISISYKDNDIIKADYYFFLTNYLMILFFYWKLFNSFFVFF